MRKDSVQLVRVRHLLKYMKITLNGYLAILTLLCSGHSHAQANRIELIKAVVELPDQATLPPYFYKQYSSEVIANSIVERIREKRDNASLNITPYFDFSNNTQILIQFQEKHIASIGRNGFLNLHQTGSGKGANEPSMRAKIEDQNATLNLEVTYLAGPENIVNELRPKYAYLQLLRLEPGLSQSNFWDSYGNVFAVLKNKVKQRSTFTAGDSFGNIDLYGKAHSFDWHGPKIDRAEPYWEAQIWGKLSSNEVDYFLVNCPNMKPISQAGLSELKTLRKQVFMCKMDSAGALVPTNL